MTSRASDFQQAAQSAEAQAKVLGKQITRLASLRLLLFFAWLALSILLFAEGYWLWAIPILMAGLLLFNLLIGKQQRAELHKRRQEKVIELNREELESLNYNFTSFDGGSDYIDHSHAFTSDLDVFGPKSVFALLNRTATLLGRTALSSYCRHCLLDAKAIRERQEAVKELGSMLAWRQDFLSRGQRQEADAEAIDRLRDWARQPAQLQQAWWPALVWALSLFNLAWLVSFAYLPFMVALLAYLPTVLLLFKYKKLVDGIQEDTQHAVSILQSMSGMLSKIEGQEWRCALLQNLARPIKTTHADKSTSQRLASLAHDAEQLAVRANPFVLLLNLFSLWEIRYARRLERWKTQLNQAGLTGANGSAALPPAAHFNLPGKAASSANESSQLAPDSELHNDLELWMLSLGAFDALSSFAGAHYRWPTWNFPLILDAEVDGNEPQGQASVGFFSGQAMHHPLLPPSKSVSNDFHSPLRKHISLLTGSNMAGKSTLLRTIGLQMAMAQWGMCTPAQSVNLRPVQVYTSMRTQDNIHEGASAFYAELNRLRIVVDATRAGEPVFFLLDEILKGTNSQDRNSGGRALLLQLLRYGGAGVVATHDLELGQLADETKDVSTLRLEVEMDAAGELYFDYTVKPGLAQSRNASALMRRLGLGV